MVTKHSGLFRVSALVVACGFLVGACAPATSVRSIDPWTAPQEEVDVALAQMETVIRSQQERIRTARYWSGSITLLVGIALEAFILVAAADDDCFNDPTPESDCVAEVALTMGAAGGAIGSGLSTLIIPTEGELDFKGFGNAEPQSPDERRAKLEYAYQLMDRPNLEGGSVIHQVGSGLFIGTGVTLLSIKAILEGGEGEGLIVPGSVLIGAGVFWAIMATVLLEPRDYDLSIRPGAYRSGAGLTLAVTF